MVELHGLPLLEAKRRMGSLAQVARIDNFVEADGLARGSRRLRLINGGGVEVDIYPDRTLDIGQVTIDSIPIAWMAPQGIAGPEFYNPAGDEWLRTFGGGMLATCGLDNFGPASVDEGVSLGRHGRIGAIPAQLITTRVDSEQLVVEAVTRQSRLFGENLTLHRRIASAIGSGSFSIDDIVTNESFTETPHMMLYHANFGWPLVDEDAEISINSDSMVPRDSIAEPGLGQWKEFDAPQPGYDEQVFVHSFDESTAALAKVTNRKLGIELSIAFDPSTLPWLYQWKQPGESAYVLGLEPGNCPVITGRDEARGQGVLPFLAPGESVSYHVEITLRRIGAGS